MVTVEPSLGRGPICLWSSLGSCTWLGTGRCKWLAQGLQGGIGTFLLHPRTLLSPSALWKPGQAHLWRPVFAWLSAAGPQGALPQWSQCGCYPLRPCAFCPPGGWGCAACLGWPGRRRDRSPGCRSRKCSPRKHLCLLGLRRVVFASGTIMRLGVGGWGEQGGRNKGHRAGRAGGIPARRIPTPRLPTPEVICYQ